MYIFKNSIKNIGRNKGRNILLGLVMTAIIAAIVAGLVINNTASAIIDDYRARFGSRVRMTLNTEMFPDALVTELIAITNEQAFALAESRYLSGYFFSAMKSGGNDELLAVAEANMPGASQRIGPAGELDSDDLILERFRVLGGSWYDEFETGERVLAEGQMPSAIGDAIISSELATLNNLSVGDTFTVIDSMIVPAETWYIENISTDFTISGIFFDSTEVPAAPMGFLMPFTNRRNEVLTTVETLLHSRGQQPHPNAYRSIWLNPTYFLRDPAYLPYFEAEAREKGLDESIVLSTDELLFRTIVEPVEGLRSILLTFVIVVLALGAIILILLSAIAIRERKYEIGVLRAMGMKKGKVLRGLLYEIGVITIVCLAIGLTVGVVASQPVADNLLQQQVEIAEGTARMGARPDRLGIEETMRRDFLGPWIPPVGEPLTEIDVRPGLPATVQIVAVSILLALAASAIGIVNITRYEPIKILMERN